MYETSCPAILTVSSTASGCFDFRVLTLACRDCFSSSVDVVGLEEDAHRGAFAEVGVEADDRDVVNDGRAHDAGDLRFADGDLLLESLADVAVDAFDDDHVAEVALPVAHEVAKPEIVREVAEPHVEALVRDVRGEGLDGVGDWGIAEWGVRNRRAMSPRVVLRRPGEPATAPRGFGSGKRNGRSASVALESPVRSVALDLSLVGLVGHELRNPRRCRSRNGETDSALVPAFRGRDAGPKWRLDSFRPRSDTRPGGRLAGSVLRYRPTIR